MSKISYRPRGGMEGIETNQNEQAQLAVAMNSKYIDEFIALPGKSIQEQVQLIKECEDHDNAIYFEDEEGSHGWCCRHCGKTIQWG